MRHTPRVAALTALALATAALSCQVAIGTGHPASTAAGAPSTAAPAPTTATASPPSSASPSATTSGQPSAPPPPDTPESREHADPAQQKISLAFMAWSRSGAGNDLSGSHVGHRGVGFATIEVPDLFDGTMPPPPGAPAGAPAFSKVDFVLGNAWNVIGKSRGPASPPGASQIKFTLKWQSADAMSPPTDQTAQ